MDSNAIIYAMYCEYLRRKGTILDSACLAKASAEMMRDDERVYSLIYIIRLYAFAGFVPCFEDISSKRILLVKKDKDITIDLPTFVSEKDRAVALLDAVSMQACFADADDRRLAVFKSLKEYYDIGKDFDFLLNSFLQGKDVETKVITRAILACNEFLDKYQDALPDDEPYDNMVNVVISEVREDLQEILATRK